MCTVSPQELAARLLAVRARTARPEQPAVTELSNKQPATGHPAFEHGGRSIDSRNKACAGAPAPARGADAAGVSQEFRKTNVGQDLDATTFCFVEPPEPMGFLYQAWGSLFGDDPLDLMSAERKYRARLQHAENMKEMWKDLAHDQRSTDSMDANYRLQKLYSWLKFAGVLAMAAAGIFAAGLRSREIQRLVDSQSQMTMAFAEKMADTNVARAGHDVAAAAGKLTANASTLAAGVGLAGVLFSGCVSIKSSLIRAGAGSASSSVVAAVQDGVKSLMLEQAYKLFTPKNLLRR